MAFTYSLIAQGKFNLSSICTLCSPDHNLVCIVESWLSSGILDSEISIHNYIVHRCDRNRHGGGILVYTFSTTVLPSPTNIELPLLSIKAKNFNLTIGTFYRPPKLSLIVI